MLKYILKRLGLAVLILLGVSLIIYVLVRSMPVSFIEGKIAEMNQGGATIPEETVESMKKLYGLEDDSFMGILKGYVNWLGKLVQFDFGTSFKYGAPVIDVIRDHMGVSFAIAFVAVILEFLIAIPLGITAATHQYTARDYVVTILVMIGISLPAFFFGQVLKDLFANKLGWFPPSGMTDASQSYTGVYLLLDYLKHMFIPVVTVVILSIGGRMRMTRTNMLEVMSSDYIRTARAKGLSERVVVYKHAFRNTLIPLVTSLAGLLPSLFSGAIITEQVFDLPGIGNVAYKAMIVADIPFIMGYNMFLALLSVLGVLLADLMYAVVDPRVKLT
jgi:peptide/nickel transport system permease protein